MIIGGQSPNTYVFVENPKCASSSLNWAFRELGGETVCSKHSRIIELPAYNSYDHRVCCVRNPWDRMVSAWANATGGNVEFEEWLLDPDPWSFYGLDMKRTPQIAWSFRCNQTMKYEYLDLSWPKILVRLHLPFIPLPQKNKSEHKPYQDYYNERTKLVVADRFAPDIKQFDYKFNE